jgi:hypothetical protein
VLRTIGLHYLAWGNRGKAAEVLEHAMAVLGDALAHGLLQIAVDSKHTIGQAQALAGLAAVAVQLQDTKSAAAYLDRTSAVLGSVEAADKTSKVALMRRRLACVRPSKHAHCPVSV